MVLKVLNILKGYKMTFKTAFKDVEVTRTFPEFMMELPANERGIHELDATVCIGCGSCARICPNNCIEMVPFKYGNPLKNKKMVFPSIDFGRCMFCGLCVDECPVSCLKMGKNVVMAGWDRDDLILGPDKISVKRHTPQEVAALEEEAKRLAAEKKKAAAAKAKAGDKKPAGAKKKKEEAGGES